MHDDWYPPAPAEVRRGLFRWLPTTVIILLVAMALGIGVTAIGWNAHWWFASRNATRQYQVTQNGVSNQDTLRAQITAKLADVSTITTQITAAQDPAEVSALKAQRAAIAGIACSDAAQVTEVPLPAQQAQWVSANCSAGSVSPGSSLYVSGAP